MKKVLRAFVAAVIITVASAIFLTIRYGWPTMEQFLSTGGTMFVVAFLAVIIWPDDNKKK